MVFCMLPTLSVLKTGKLRVEAIELWLLIGPKPMSSPIKRDRVSQFRHIDIELETSLQSREQKTLHLLASNCTCTNTSL